MNEGYELLIEDYRFIDNILDNFSRVDFKTILERYLEEWCEGMGKDRSCNQAQGNGRRRANTWLFERNEHRKSESMKKTASQTSWENCFD